MSYDLYLRFDPAVPLARFQQHFGDRGRYDVQPAQMVYFNPDTKVEFTIRFEAGRSPAWPFA